MNKFLYSLILLIIVSCKSKTSSQNDVVIGHWITEVMSSEWGDVQHEIIFKDNNEVVQKLRFVDRDEMIFKGEYLMEECSKIKITLLIDGRKEERLDNYEMQGNDILIIRDESEIYKFSRKK